jgi:hypothetical protein
VNDVRAGAPGLSRELERASAALRRFARNREAVIAVAVVLLLTVTLVALKMVNGSNALGDAAFYEQTTENIADRGAAVSSLQANILSIAGSPYLTMTAEQIAKAPLPPPKVREIDVLRWHGYVILYLLAPFVKVFPTEAVLLTADVLSFVGVVALAYFYLRRRNVGIGAALLFCLLAVSHPAWSEGLLVWQFYPDRLFVIGGFALLYLASRERTPPLALIAVAALSAMVNERGGLVGGFFLIAYAALFRGRLSKKAVELRAVTGVVMVLYGVVMIKLVLTNFYYSSFMPSNVAQAVALLQKPQMADKLGMLLLVNAVFLLFACFAWRTALIAAIAILPNVFGSIGGAEKVGWATHYHAYYLPAVLWAALVGYERGYRFAGSDRVRRAAYLATSAVAVLLLLMVDPYSFQRFSMSPANIAQTFIPKFWHQTDFWLLTPGRAKYRPLAGVIDKAIPPGSTVSAQEVLMPYLYRDRTVRYFPIGIDDANYAVMSTDRSSGTLVYGGAVNYLGPEESKRVNAALVKRMKRDGYDFVHPTFIPELGVAVIARR